VGLAEGRYLKGVRLLDETRRHARDLAPAVADLLAAQGWKARDVQGVVVSRGPGSYTGLRVGVMSAKAFAYATGCALLAVDTFAAIALQAPEEAARLDVLADAQQDKVYVQPFARPGPDTPWHPVAPLVIRKLTEWLTDLGSEVWVSGPGLHLHRNRLPAEGRVAPSDRWDPQLESLLEIGLARYSAGGRDDLWTVEPLYLRPSSAEEKLQERPPP
jgi:tRNA threonylcarbamoyladenosine biosynthesis protein TsaB